MVVFFPPLRNTMASVWPTARYSCPETDALHAHNGLISQGGQCVCVMTQGRPGLDGQSVLVVHAKISWEFAGQGGSHSIALQERENQQVQNEPKFDLMLFLSHFFLFTPLPPFLAASRHTGDTLRDSLLLFSPSHSQTIPVSKRKRYSRILAVLFRCLNPFLISDLGRRQRDWWRWSQIPAPSWPPIESCCKVIPYKHNPLQILTAACPHLEGWWERVYHRIADMALDLFGFNSRSFCSLWNRLGLRPVTVWLELILVLA